jgi:serine/threonine-protein kinase/endoribonuclease IRE1
MAHSFSTTIFLLFLATCYAGIVAQQSLSPQPITDVAPHRNVLISEARDQQTAAPFDDPLDLLDIILVASVDGKLHALNRTSGNPLWTMSSPASTSSHTTALQPLVGTQHPADHQTDADSNQEVYIIEPQSGNIFVLASPGAPLQRLPLSMSQLIELSPYSISGEDGTKVFVGKKETSLVLIELETGRIQATLNTAECPWSPFEDLSRDRQEEDVNSGLDLDELDGTRPRRVKSTSTEIFIGRTGKFYSLIRR